MKTLLLSVDWIVDRVIGWEEAMCLVCSGRAEVIEPYENEFIRSGQSTFNVPCVIKYTRGDVAARAKRGKRKVTKSILYERDEKCCQYCGKPLKKSEVTIDHIIPKSRGGNNSWKNLVVSCTRCNNIKRDRTTEEAGKPIHRAHLVKEPSRGLYTVRSLEIHTGESMQENWRAYVKQDSESLGKGIH